MIDRFAFTAMTGAKHAMGQLATTTHNMANLQTPGSVKCFRCFELYR
jgi:flagellar basal-body rod protein FlgF